MGRDLFGTSKAFIGVVHLLPLPGSPRWGGNMRAVIDRAEQEANILEQGGVNGIIVENFGDVPFRTGRLDPETIASMTVAVERVEEVVFQILIFQMHFQIFLVQISLMIYFKVLEILEAEDKEDHLTLEEQI